jgi:hypothetical protein
MGKYLITNMVVMGDEVGEREKISYCLLQIFGF